MAKKYTKLSEILRKLLFERNMKAVDLARKVDLPQPTVHRLVTGKSTRPYKSSLKPIADYFGVTIDQLIGEEPLAKGETPKTYQPIQTRDQIHNIPLLNWEQITTTTESPEYHLERN
jgi:transcriptional regulator with XRE-family HTH domain